MDRFTACTLTQSREEEEGVKHTDPERDRRFQSPPTPDGFLLSRLQTSCMRSFPLTEQEGEESTLWRLPLRVLAALHQHGHVLLLTL